MYQGPGPRSWILPFLALLASSNVTEIYSHKLAISQDKYLKGINAFLITKSRKNIEFQEAQSSSLWQRNTLKINPERYKYHWMWFIWSIWQRIFKNNDINIIKNKMLANLSEYYSYITFFQQATNKVIYSSYVCTDI